MRGFTLIELLVVLVVVSLVSFLVVPSFINRIGSRESFQVKLSNVLKNISSLSENRTVCVDFKEGKVLAGGGEVKSGLPIDCFVSPGRLYSPEDTEEVCLTFNDPNVFSIIFRAGEDRFRAFTTLTSTGEVIIQELDEAEEETLKDKMLKGRILEWFKRH